MFFTFIRELLFDSKEEFDYRSSKFNSRKMTLYIIFIALFLAVVLLTNRVYKQSVYVVKLKDAIILQEARRREKDLREDKELIRLRTYVEDLPEKVKKSYPVPSDSGNLVEKTISTTTDDAPTAPIPEPKPVKALPPAPLAREDRKSFIEKYMDIKE